MQKRLLICLILILVPLFQNCSSTQDPDSSKEGAAQSAFYFSAMTKLTVAVYYEPGAEPYVGVGTGGRPYWGILEENLSAIFQYRSAQPTLVVPKVLNDMSHIPSQSKSEWTTDQIMQLHSTYGSETSVSGEANFHIYFVNGHYRSSSGVENSVIGVNITGTPVIAIFKDVVKATGANPNGAVPKFVEQSTLVHEMGHALGLVNIGVPLTSAHQDVNHGAHSTNSDCVMYWANEGVGDLQQFVIKYITSSSVVMWGPEVLADVQAVSH